jgi:hypothetical protein
MAILDEIDRGLDIDALRDVAGAVNGLKTPQRSVLMVTHYRVSGAADGQRLAGSAAAASRCMSVWCVCVQG